MAASPMESPPPEVDSSEGDNLSPIRRVTSNESRGSNSLSPTLSEFERDAKSTFWETNEYGVESAINLQSADQEKRISTQQTTFANWVNERLKSGGKVKVTDLTVELQDGTILVRLLENLTGKKIKGFHKAPSLPAHKLDNLDLVFSFLKSNGIKVIGIGSHNIFKGDINLILGLIWTLIQKYQLRMEGTKVSTKAVMIDWLKALLPSWNITNLTTDWNDGRALVALINEVKPGIAPNVATLDPTKRRVNCSQAIEIAYNHLKIPKLISAHNLSRLTIDELSIITYLSYFRDPARARLLKWVKKMLPQFNITNFVADWTDGRAFAALANKCFSGVLPHFTMQEKERVLENVQRVLAMIERKLGTGANFTAKNLQEGEVDELQVMTLVMRIRDGKLEPLADEVVVSGPGITKAMVGKVTSFNVYTADAGPGILSIEANYQGGQSLDYSTDKQRKMTTVTYCPFYSGKIEFNIRWSGEPVPHSPFTVTASDLTMVKILDFDHHQKVVHVNEPIELSMDTERAGQGSLTAHLRYGKEMPIKAEVVKDSDSVTKLRYTPKKSGQPILHVFWNGEEMSHLSIAYTVLDNTCYSVISTPESRMYRILEDVKFSIQTTGLGGTLNALHMTAITEEDDVQAPIHFDNIEGSVGHAIFHPTLPGTYRIEIACIDQLVEGSPFQFDVVDPSRCRVLGAIPKYLQANTPFTFEVDVKHAGKGDLSFKCDEEKYTDTFDTSITQADHSGISKVTVTPHREGVHLISFKFQGTEIPGCPLRVLVCDPSRCKVSGEVLEKKSAMVSKPIRFQVTVDPIERLKPTITATGPSAKYTPEIREKEENVYTVQFTPWEVGTHDISITYGDFHIPNSPFLVSVATFDSTICSATGSGLQKAFTGIPAQFVVLAKQEGLLKDGTLQVKVQGVMNGVECKVRARDNGNGSYNVAYLIHDPGAYLISIVTEGKPIAGSPFRLTALPGPTAGKCRMYGPILQPNALLTIGNPMDFTVDASAAGVGNLSVKAVGPGGTQARVYLAKGGKKGIHSIKLDPIRHGKYRVNVKWSGEHIPGSPFMLKIYPGADPSKCRAHGPGLEDGIVGRASMFTIETRDAGAGTLKVRLHGVRDAFKIEIKPVNQRDIRTLQANYNPKKPGDYLVSIKWSEKHIPGSPFRVRITGDGPVLEDDNTPSRALKATPRDESLNPIAEEIDEGNWGDENDDRAAATSPSPVPPKRKKKQKKSNKTSSSKDESISAPVSTSNEIPRFDHTSMRTNYKEAFTGGPVVKGKSSKTMKGGRGSPVKSVSSSVLPQNKMMTFSGLQELHKHTQSEKGGRPAYHPRGLHSTRPGLRKSRSDTSTDRRRR